MTDILLVTYNNGDVDTVGNTACFAGLSGLRNRLEFTGNSGKIAVGVNSIIYSLKPHKGFSGKIWRYLVGVLTGIPQVGECIKAETITDEGAVIVFKTDVPCRQMLWAMNVLRGAQGHWHNTEHTVLGNILSSPYTGEALVKYRGLLYLISENVYVEVAGKLRPKHCGANHSTHVPKLTIGSALHFHKNLPMNSSGEDSYQKLLSYSGEWGSLVNQSSCDGGAHFCKNFFKIFCDNYNSSMGVPKKPNLGSVIKALDATLDVGRKPEVKDTGVTLNCIPLELGMRVKINVPEKFRSGEVSGGCDGLHFAKDMAQFHGVTDKLLDASRGGNWELEGNSWTWHKDWLVPIIDNREIWIKVLKARDLKASERAKLYGEGYRKGWRIRDGK